MRWCGLVETILIIGYGQLAKVLTNKNEFSTTTIALPDWDIYVFSLNIVTFY